ncbi:MAG: hypothetical protein ACPHVP_00120 [Flavobacteriales bacterium]
MKLKIIIKSILMLCANLGLAQTVLNGSFEDNSLDNNFHYGLGTESFANNVNHAFAFCEDDTLTLAMNKKSAKDGDWSIILYENLGGDGLNYSKNFISMKLSENLEVGKNYSISFYTKNMNLMKYHILAH